MPTSSSAEKAESLLRAFGEDVADKTPLGVIGEAEDFALLFDQGADFGSFQGAVAYPQFGDLLGEPFAEFPDDGAVHEEAVGRGAGFAHVAHFGLHGPVDCLFDVRVGQDDEGGVSAQFRCLNRQARVLRSAVGDVGDDFLRGRILDRDRGAAGGLLPGTVDEQVRMKSSGIK
ncbi:hypothetical protein J2805_004367 [Arthrobacter oryzae]|nr:hypothetical protein [Arthrobacter oryzae]